MTTSKATTKSANPAINFCICGKTHKSLSKYHRCLGKTLKMAKAGRNQYEAIGSFYMNSKSVVSARTILFLFSPCLDAEYCDFDKKGRGEALNHDLYGYDAAQGVAVIQSRLAFRRHNNDYMSTRKTYTLCGFNEITGAKFRHPVSAAAIRGAIRAGADFVDVVKAAQRWMWQVTEKQLAASVRQGDLLLVPAKGEPKGENQGTIMTIGGSHEVRANEIREDDSGKVFALNPQITHTKGQHAPVAYVGWVSVRVAQDEPAWKFARRIVD